LIVGLFLLGLLLIGGAISLSVKSKRSVVYDCRISEISPDFPPEVREMCRKRIREQSGRI
jgi:hypothetical protein